MARGRVKAKLPAVANGEDEGAEQSETERRHVRSKYRDLKEAIANENHDLGRIESDKFDALLNSVDDLYKEVHRPRELIADAEALGYITSSLLDCAKKYIRADGPSSSEFTAALIRKFGVHNDADNVVQINWEALDIEASCVLGVAPGMCTMIGPMQLDPPKQRKAVVQRTKQPAGQGTRPEEVVEDGEENGKGETDKTMEVMFNILCRCKRTRLESLVLNRTSFSQAVENLFALAFLVKDGRVEIVVEEDGLVVVPRNAPTADDRANGVVMNSQFVLRFGFEDWKVMQEAVKEGDELMPHRSSSSSTSPTLTPVRKTSRNRARDLQSEEQHCSIRKKLRTD